MKTMKTSKDIDKATLHAITINITRQAIREDWIVNFSAKQASDKIDELLKERNIIDSKFTDFIMLSIVSNY